MLESVGSPTSGTRAAPATFRRVRSRVIVPTVQRRPSPNTAPPGFVAAPWKKRQEPVAGIESATSTRLLLAGDPSWLKRAPDAPGPLALHAQPRPLAPVFAHGQ